jgi:diaminopimelate epimerase
MKINYCYVNPGGNPTALVLTKVPIKSQAGVAKRIIQLLPKPCEQVGFIEPAKDPSANFRLQMMGGEFCGNAARAAGVFLAKKSKYKSSFEFKLESSGVNELLTIFVRINKNNQITSSEFSGYMPSSNKKMKLALGSQNVPVIEVNLQGITQFVLPERFYEKDLDYLRAFKKLCKKQRIKSMACGLIFYKEIIKNKFTITPIVYVKSTQTLFKETSCASGSMALASALNREDISVLQPSGSSLRIKMNFKTNWFKVGGRIREVSFGTLKI